MFDKSKLKLRYLFIPVLLLFWVLVPFDWFMGQYTGLAIMIGIYTIVTVGLCLLMGYTGQVSLGHAAYFGMGGYISAILSTTYNVNPWLAMLIAAVITGAFASMIGHPILRLRGNYLALATLAVGALVWDLAKNLSQFTGGPDGMAGIPYLAIGSFEFDTPFRRYFLVWGFCLVILILSQNIINSRTGRALRAIHGSETAAESLGINVDRFKVNIFILSAIYASIAGSLFAHHLCFMSPGCFSILSSVKLVVMAVVGGLASIWGAIFGAGITKILSDELLLRFGEWDVAGYGLMLVLIMIFMPEGVFPTLKAAYERDGFWFFPKWLWNVGHDLFARFRNGYYYMRLRNNQEEARP
jgi:branched-chain amino acid transport system permease protein